jgi:hypothetical protein
MAHYSSRSVLRIATAFACLGVTASASAQVVIDIPADVACAGFPLRVELYTTAGHLMDRVFIDKNGNPVRILQAGQNFPVKFTNLTTGSTYSVKAEGTVLSVTLNPDGSETHVMTGHTLISWTVTDPQDASPAPGTFRYVGRLVMNVANGNVLTVPKFTGKKTDICAALS